MTPATPDFRHERTARLVVGLLGLTVPTFLVVTCRGAAPDAGFNHPFVWFLIGLVLAYPVGIIDRHPFRVLGFVPLLALGWLSMAAYGIATGSWPAWAHGAFFGLTASCLNRAWPANAQSMAERATVGGFAVIGFLIAALFGRGILLQEWAGWSALGGVGLLALAAWYFLFRPLVELAVEPVLALMYRIRGRGPALAAFPMRGPCLVVANHACWFDPLFLAKVLPRPITPMMTSVFYDLPLLRWFMTRVFHTIRVPEKAYKQDTPEIRAAVAALDRGECVVIFPEGYLRRSEGQPLRRFGRGVWQILRERPGTPVFACWIEGGWGSYCSYFNGKPTRNKRPDVRRPIGVAVTGPILVDEATLAEHLRTRIELMNRVLAARTELGLVELPAFELPSFTAEDAEQK